MANIAFIPVRGGSKSIPLKNIKSLCGKPLVYWTAKAASEVKEIDKVVVATDNDEIASVVTDFQLPKVEVYRRSSENAGDTSSTESVILEYFKHSTINKNDFLILVQATSPLLQSTHLKKGLSEINQYDSLLSVARTKRFFWKNEGVPLNYDYRNRPRRQDFDGLLVENGAFYISRVADVIKSGNRISGNIGLVEMPEYTAYEIDEKEDWIIVEELMRRFVLPQPDTEKSIKLFISDVDGVLTDAGMYYTEKGDELKKFNTHDGMAFGLLRASGVKTGLVTSEKTQIVSRRAKKLKVDYVCQGKKHNGKLQAVEEICRKEKFDLSEVAYIGDDVNCYELLSAVGLAACPSNAVETIKNIPGIHKLSKKGGDGVVREFYENLLKNRI
ncbi:acylneuraminate cytidylyltransferase [Allomuricauda sp. SCSIO 65647]|uniref:acylneuraminate cytidylyltransferase n=1 Tax=Allomuricauda sp. SCSIO 65647 TaxID=2908843 RepID=UPI001F22E2B3|nr:acylneuraminate cytidylyltransferase [Muricauda sp. SCSIO 65647]UJH69045.1 acylneuraminate cytidylyltransferase [Muricauda sp. SCSIO 65647]